MKKPYIHDWEYQINVWSNALYAVTGLLAFLWYGLTPVVPALVALSAASGMYHYTGHKRWQLLDEDAMYAVLVALVVEVGGWVLGVNGALMWMMWAALSASMIWLNHVLPRGLDSDWIMPIGAVVLAALITQTEINLGHGMYLLAVATASGVLQITARLGNGQHRWWHSGWHFGTCLLITGILKLQEVGL